MQSSSDFVVTAFWRNNNPDAAAYYEGTWEAFLDDLREPLPSSIAKNDLPLWSPAGFVGGKRDTDRVSFVGALVLDVDEQPVPSADELRAALAPFRAVAHTSSRSTAAAPRWRVVLDFSRAVTREEYDVLRPRIIERLPFAAAVGREASDAARQWYVPRRGPDESYELLLSDGAPLDVDAILAAAPPKPTEQPRDLATPPAAAPGPTSSSTRRAAAAQLLGSAWPAPGSRHVAQRALAGALCRDRWDQADAVDFVCTVCRIAGDEDRSKREQTVSDTYARAAAGRAYEGWTALSAHVDPAIVQSARGLLDVFAGARASLESELAEQSAASAPPERAPAPTTFPVDALPPALRNFVEAQAEFTQVPVDLPAMLALGACSAAVAGKIDLEVQSGYVEPLNLYVVCALPTGERKTPNFEAALAPLRQVEQERAAAAKGDIAKRRSMRVAKEKLLAKKQNEYASLGRADLAQEWKSNQGGAAPAGGLALQREIEDLAAEIEEMKIEALPQLIAEDVTPERFGSLLAEHGGRMCVASDEGGLFDILAGRYSKDGKANFDVFLKAYSGSHCKIDRQSKERLPIDIPRPIATLVLSPQPGVLEQLHSPAMRSKGLLARFLYSLPASMVGRRRTRTRPVPEPVRAAYEEAVRRLALIPTIEERAATAEGIEQAEACAGRIPRLRLSEEASELHLAFREEVEGRYTGDLHEITDWASKWPGNVARIAGVLHLAGGAGIEDRVSGSTMTNAIAIGRYLLPHALAAFGSMGAPQAALDARDIWRWIERRGLESFCVKDLARLGPGHLRGERRRQAEALDVLVDEGRLRVDGARFLRPLDSCDRFCDRESGPTK